MGRDGSFCEYWGDASGVEEGYEEGGYAGGGYRGEGEGGRCLGYADQEGDQEAVAGVQGVGEQGEDVAAEGAEKAEDEDGPGERYSYEIR